MHRRTGLAALTAALLFTAAPAFAQQQNAPSAAAPSPRSDRILIYIYGCWRSPAGERNDVKTKSGSWMPFPPDGMAIEGQITCAGAAAVRLPRTRLDEIRRLVEEEIPPHKWHVLDEGKLTSLPPHIHQWGCHKF